jgi:hypothetical protein
VSGLLGDFNLVFILFEVHILAPVISRNQPDITDIHPQ